MSPDAIPVGNTAWCDYCERETLLNELDMVCQECEERIQDHWLGYINS